MSPLIELYNDIKKAAQIINTGGLVAMPTETVYGLAADAFNKDAVARIYSAKGRPGDNPLILHIANIDQFLELSDSPPPYAMALAKAYWPGPLTLIVKKKPHLPGWLGGHPQRTAETVGIRMPAHPAAKALIEAAGCPLCAPSANKAGKPSPTTAAHVAEDFAQTGEVEMILDGKSSEIGVESTVVDVTGAQPVILRPGAITEAMIREVTAKIATTNFKVDDDETNAPRAPGMKYRHYAPKAPMTIFRGEPGNVAAQILDLLSSTVKTKPENSHPTIGVLVTDSAKELLPSLPPNVKLLSLGSTNKSVAKNLFAHLRQFDNLGVSVIYAEAVPNTDLGTAIMDRMQKAAEGNIIDV